MKKITAYGLYFGVPEAIPQIPGFGIIAKADQWLLAVQGDRQFFVQKRPRGFRLFPRSPRGARTDQAIYIGLCVSAPSAF